MKDKKLYIVRKYIMAENARQAMEIEKKRDVDDIWLDEDWKENKLKRDIGF